MTSRKRLIEFRFLRTATQYKLQLLLYCTNCTSEYARTQSNVRCGFNIASSEVALHPRFLDGCTAIIDREASVSSDRVQCVCEGSREGERREEEVGE